ncbi:MAG: putative DsbA family dithiol-disulfide isomerase [Psychromonas sp.]|jgi:predicted DsbA family dithiol-disulfide isomerase
MKNNTIKIDVVSDVACPWCYVGKRRLEAALKQWKGAPVEVTWHPYQLDPSMRVEGMDRDTYLTNKFGSIEHVQEMTDRLTEVGKTEGINFDFGDNWLAVNTLPLHQMLSVARKEGFGTEMKERFLAAYFEESQHLNKLEVLYDIATDFGWNSEKVDEIINDKSIAVAVKEEINLYQERGVKGVPFFVVNDKYGISGAQPVEVFLEAFESVSSDAGVSDVDGCDTAIEGQ